MEAEMEPSEPARPAGKLFLVGFGPGSHEHLTFRAKQAIDEAEVVIGYRTYIRLVRDLIQGKQIIYTGMTEELARARKAVDLAYAGRKVALISSGDVGIYGMAGPTFEILKERGWHPDNGLHVEVIPGVTALSSCGSVLGAPIMHDFCSISLSDLLTPWDVIVKRIEAAAQADFVIALYNPKSGRRTRQIVETQRILLQHRFPNTPVGLVKSCRREMEKIVVSTLADMLNHEIGMLTTVIVGNSKTFVHDGLMITPRGYQSKYELRSLDDVSVASMRRQYREQSRPMQGNAKGLGTLYGVGVGPGFSHYLTMQAKEILEKVRYLFYPRGSSTDESMALTTIEPYMKKDAAIQELYFPMTKDSAELHHHWKQNAKKVADVLAAGQDAAFITIGDSTLYSTYGHLVRTLRKLLPEAPVETVPGISSISAAAGLLDMVLGENKERVAIVPVDREVSNVRDAVERFDTVVLLKVGSKLDRVVDLLEEMGAIDRATFLSYIGSEDEVIEQDLRKFKGQTAGYMSLIVVKKDRPEIEQEED